MGRLRASGLKSAAQPSRKCLSILRLVAGSQFLARVTPLGLFVDRVICDLPQGANELPVLADPRSRDARPWRFIHEGHELVGESGHGASDADAAHVGAAADPAHPA